MPYQLLTKTKYLNGLQCLKLLWTQIHQPERIPETDATIQHLFDQEHIVGELAKKLFPGGVDIPADDFMGNIKQTRRLLEQRIPLFEAGIFTGDLYSRVDILNPAGEDGWDIVEVKMSTGVKEVHYDDVAFQKYCCGQQGLEISKCFLAHVNNQYVKEGEIDPRQLFIVQDITAEVDATSQGI